MGAMGEPIERTVGEDRIVEEGDPFVDGAITGDDRGGAPGALDEDIVEIARLLGGEFAQAEVVEDEEPARASRVTASSLSSCSL